MTTMLSSVGLLVGLMIACGIVFSACSGGEQEEPAPAALERQQAVAEPAQPQAGQLQAAAQDLEQTAAASVQEQAVEQAAQQSAALEESTAHENQQQQVPAEPQSDSADDDPAVLSLLAEIAELHQAWIDNLETYAATVDATVEGGLFSFEQQLELRVQLEPLTVYTLMEIVDPLGGLSADEGSNPGSDASGDSGSEANSNPGSGAPAEFVLELLIREDGVYLALPDSEYWTLAPSGEELMSQLSPLIRGGLDDLSDVLSARALFLCAEVSSGTVREETFNDRAAWLISCDIDIDAVDEVLSAIEADGGNAAALAGGSDAELLQAISQSVWIDRENGALLALEAVVVAAIDDELSSGADADSDSAATTVTTALRMISWNQPVAFPEPEPLMDDSGRFK